MRQPDVEVTSTRTLEDVAGTDQAEVALDERPRVDPGRASLAVVDMAVPAEDEFGVGIPREHGRCFETVGGAAGCVRHATTAAHRPAGAEPALALEESR